MIISILHHISNNHQFASLPLFPECAHGPIEVEKAWIKSGLVLVYFYKIHDFITLLDSKAMENLRKAIMGKKGHNLFEGNLVRNSNVKNKVQTFAHIYEGSVMQIGPFIKAS